VDLLGGGGLRPGFFPYAGDGGRIQVPKVVRSPVVQHAAGEHRPGAPLLERGIVEEGIER